MCGIVGFVGRRPALPILISGLKRLEYRGYDSSGVALLEDGDLTVNKSAGRISVLEPLLDMESPLVAFYYLQRVRCICF